LLTLLSASLCIHPPPIFLLFSIRSVSYKRKFLPELLVGYIILFKLTDSLPNLYKHFCNPYLISETPNQRSEYFTTSYKPVKWLSFLICYPLYCHITGCSISANDSRQLEVTHTINFQSNLHSSPPFTSLCTLQGKLLRSLFNYNSLRHKHSHVWNEVWWTFHLLRTPCFKMWMASGLWFILQC
jgi:hypothetical protein